MPMSTDYIGDGGIISRGEGVVTGSEIKEVNDIIYESPEKIKNIVYQICDLTNVSNISLSNSEIEEIAEQDSKAFQINPNMFIAIVADDDLIYGLSRMWEALAYDYPFESTVFRTMDDAQQWIREKLVKKPNHVPGDD